MRSLGWALGHIDRGRDTLARYRATEITSTSINRMPVIEVYTLLDGNGRCDGTERSCKQACAISSKASNPFRNAAYAHLSQKTT